MNAYPVLQRKLGLVADFVIDRTAVPLNGDLQLSAEVEFAAGALSVTREPDVRPVTHATHTKQGFFAKSNQNLTDDATRVQRGLSTCTPSPTATPYCRRMSTEQASS
jgi:hypothetical protein